MNLTTNFEIEQRIGSLCGRGITTMASETKKKCHTRVKITMRTSTDFCRFSDFSFSFYNNNNNNTHSRTKLLTLFVGISSESN